jgi:hypothetical protein
MTQKCCGKCEIGHKNWGDSYTCYCPCHTQYTNQDWREKVVDILNEGIIPKLVSGEEVINNYNKVQNLINFIQQELDRQRQEIREKIKLMEIYDIDDTSLTPIAMHGYNQAINEIIKLL